MKHHIFYGVTAVFLSASVFVHSLKSANAFPQGPNISLGSNPIDNAIAVCNSSYSTLFSNNSTQAFVVTDITRQHPSYPLSLRIDNQEAWIIESGGHPQIFQFQSGLKIAPGSSLDCAHSGFRVMISGYYTQS